VSWQEQWERENESESLKLLALGAERRAKDIGRRARGTECRDLTQDL
jgi:hypothetical protein